MKRMMLAIIAAIFGGFAQAITTSWQNGSAAVSGIGENTSWFTVTVTAAVAEGAAWGGDKPILTYSVNGDKNYGIVAYGNGFGFRFHGETNDAWSQESASTAAGEYKLSMMFERGTYGSETGWHVTFGITRPGETMEIIATSGNVAFVTDAELGLSDGSFTLTGHDVSGISITDVKVLPEPTALALLALGVAGAVLRRKVA